MKTMLAGALGGAFVLISSCGACADSTPPLQLTLESYKSPRPEAYLLGEEVVLGATLRNNGKGPVRLVGRAFGGLDPEGDPWSWHLEGTGEAIPCGARVFVMHGEPRAFPMAPGEKVATQLMLPWRFGPGRYEVWIEYDPVTSTDWFLRKNHIQEFRLQSNRVSFEVVPPAGLDGQAYDQCSHWALELKSFKEEGIYPTCRPFQDLPNARRCVQEKFPSSIYAGWGWCCANPQDPRKMVSLLRQRVASYNDPSVPKPIAETNAYARVLARQRRDEMVAYLALHREFVDADRLRLGVAYQSLVAGDLAPATVELERLQGVPDLPPWMKEQVEALIEYAKPAVATTPLAQSPASGSPR